MESSQIYDPSRIGSRPPGQDDRCGSHRSCNFECMTSGRPQGTDTLVFFFGFKEIWKNEVYPQGSISARISRPFQF